MTMHIEITPAVGPADHPIAIRVFDAQPRGRVTVTAETVDRDGRTWASEALFLAGEDGSFDLTKEAPLQGSYSTADPVGLITSLAPKGPGAASIFTPPDPSGYRITVSAGDAPPSDAVRRFQAPEVEARVVAEGEVQGTLYAAGGTEPRPAVLLVPGFIDPQVAAHPLAAMLASRGYACFVADYMSESSIPGSIAIIPLELLEGAVGWLRNQSSVDSDRIAGYGIEKGAEALLAAACRLPGLALSAIVASSPSCVVWQATGHDRTAPISSWTARGEPLPFLPLKLGRGQKVMRTLKKREGGAVAQLPAHMEAFQDHEAFRRASLPVEKIDAPILLLAGNEDQVWPSGQMSELLYRARRASRGHEGDQKLVYEKVGHIIRFPYLPTSVNRWLDADRAAGLVLGGTPEANLHADQGCWAKTLEFLGAHLGQPAPIGQVASP